MGHGKTRTLYRSGSTSFWNPLASAPVDNWAQGGVGASIDTQKGVIRRAAVISQNTDLAWLDYHSDTETSITGTQIPHWKKFTSNLLKIAKALPMLPYIGWDIVMQEDSFRIIEANNHSNVRLLQMHEPLLCDKRVRNFYRHYDVVP